MKIYILDKEIELENKLESIENIFNMINEILYENEKDYNFSYMIVDGKEIYDEFEYYIEDNIQNIKEIKVGLLTLKELVNDNILTIKEYLDRAIPAIKELSDQFYREPNVGDWQDIANLFEGIGWILETYQSIDCLENLNDIVSSYETWNEYVKEVRFLNDQLGELQDAMENSDNILIGDLLSYEIEPIFENMKVKIESLVNI